LEQADGMKNCRISLNNLGFPEVSGRRRAGASSGAWG
jgi:hypothetical protein